MWVNHYNSIVASYQPSDVLFVRYEDLRNEATRVDTMRTVTDFLKVTIAVIILLYYIINNSLLILTLFVLLPFLSFYFFNLMITIHYYYYY